MRTLWMTVLLLASTGFCMAAPPEPLPTLPVGSPLSPGTKATLRVRQVVPIDGLSRGERMLNSLPPLQEGDVFTAEVVGMESNPMILAGCVESVTPPRRFGRAGTVSVKLAWPLDSSGSREMRWGFDVEDQRFSSAQKRRAITTLFLAEGFVMGASVGSTLDHGKSAAALGGGGVGLALGVAYASLQRGHEASLEPGDQLSVIVGSADVKKLPPETPLTVYPAREPEREKSSSRKKP